MDQVNKITTVDEYISEYQHEIEKRLILLRKLITSTVPNTIESISYGMPAYKYKGKPLVYFAAFKNHIGLYATPDAHAEFANELKTYKQGKGSVQFPNDKELPLELIKKMILFKKSLIDG